MRLLRSLMIMVRSVGSDALPLIGIVFTTIFVLLASMTYVETGIEVTAYAEARLLKHCPGHPKFGPRGTVVMVAAWPIVSAQNAIESMLGEYKWACEK